MAAPVVSVVIPAWNAALFLARAVQSVLAQRAIDQIEIVIVDDCSTDATVTVAEALAARHAQIRLLRNLTNSGPARSRNEGIRAARGDWIAVLDADDAFEPDRLARMTEVADAEGLDVLADLPVLFDLSAGQAAPVQLPAPGGVIRLDLAQLLRVSDSDFDLGLMKPIYRRKLVEQGFLIYPETIRHGEDHRLYIDLIRKGVTFGLLREPHYVFSTRIGAISGAYSPGSVTNVDYPALARQNDALAAELDSAGELTPELAGLIALRRAKALRQNRIYGWTTLRKREWRRLLRWLRQDSGNIFDLMRVLSNKLLGHRGLPD